ncbi:heme biosynthesis protein HemY [Methyloceanibacter stevinii]|uniref:Heme biosynthesis protein HemY n=1 Tax=Methyloceanibacter stevinii TaxID=1774970 RepID=A0A1E3VNF9_9HYPH|nr:iron-sulfur cluster assembly accessory protein [Methyloceanibacter stevinii]ODR95059.1 heme biosynthesis protein HemY [Methyloceanibacter stevinii]
MSFTVTRAAEKFIRRLLMFDGGPGSALRLAVSPGGCSGLSAEFDVESAPREGDKLVEVGDIRFFLPAESRLLLEGVTIDFAETPTSSGFVFLDPNAASCGCSTEDAAESVAG